jgi:hypothetical protein
MIYCPDIEKLVRIDGKSTYAHEGDCQINPNGVSKTEITQPLEDEGIPLTFVTYFTLSWTAMLISCDAGRTAIPVGSIPAPPPPM